MPESKQEIPIEVVEVDPNETHTPQKTLFRATKDSIAGGKALPKRPVSAVKSANSDVHKASSKSPFDLTALSPAKVFQPKPRQQKAELPNLSPQQPKPEPTAMSTTGVAAAPTTIPPAPKPKKIAVVPNIRPSPALPRKTAMSTTDLAVAPATIPPAPKPKKIAVAPNTIPPAPKPEPTAMSTTGLAVAPATIPPAPKPKKIAVAPNTIPPAPKPRKTAMSTTGLAVAPATIPPAPKPKKIAVAPNTIPPAPKPRKTAMSTTGVAAAPATISPAPKPKKIAVAPNTTPPAPKPRKTAMSTTGVAAAPATISPAPKPKKLGQSGTRLSGRTPYIAQSSRKTGVASLLGGTVGVSSRNFSGDYLASLPNSNRDRQAASGIDASSQNIDITSYLKQLQQQVKQQWLPEVSQSSRRTVLNFTINRSGQLRNLQLAQTSGFSVTDQAALKAIQRAAPFAPLPPGYTSNHIDIQFTFNINVYGQLNLSGDGG
ncbi:energy transducer TonB family protein [Nostoc sp.]